jgi:hypothetical protein
MSTLHTSAPTGQTDRGLTALRQLYPGTAWCIAAEHEYAFLGPNGGHPRRSNYARRAIRPAADGWYQATSKRSATPVLVEVDAYPGRILMPWPAATPGQPFTPPRGRGRPGIADEAPLANWLPILPGLTAHGLRHGHQTWMEELGTPRVLIAERMGHELPSMQGVYAHVTPTMRAELVAALDRLWTESLDQRNAVDPHSAVPVLDALLAERRVIVGCIRRSAMVRCRPALKFPPLPR